MRWRPRTLHARLALVFTLLTLLLAVVVGLFVVQQFTHALDSSIDDGLHERYTEIETALAKSSSSTGRPTLRSLIPDVESFAQIVDDEGIVEGAVPRSLREAPLLDPADLDRARAGRIELEADVAPGGGAARLLAGPDRAGDAGTVIIVGTSLKDAHEAEDRLIDALVVGLTLFTVAVSVGGWYLVGATLKPVRRLMVEAGNLSVRDPGARLTPQGGDELRELAAELNAMLERIESGLLHERAFLDDASHELRTPIAIVRGEVELARMRLADDPESVATLDSVAEEVTRLDQLATNLLVLARTRASRVSSHPIPSLAAVAERAVLSVRRTRNDRVDFEVTGDAAMVGDETAIERAITNLVDNAQRYATGRVTVELRDETGSVIIDVVDDGPGFPAAVLAGGFERFGGGASTGRPDGAGLGLVIVAEIVRAHGGTTTATNRPGGGARATLRFPRSR